MNKQLIGELVEEGKARHAALTKPWKPFKRIAWVISAASTAYTYRRAAGEFTPALIGLVILTCFLSLSPRFAPSVAGIQLLGRRMLALFADFLIISLVSFGSLILYQSKDYLGLLLMLVVWIGFLYFVLLDWRFNGTLGKKLWGLKVVNTTQTEMTFCKSFIRVFLTSPLPIVCSGLLRDVILGHDASRFRFFLGEGSAEAVLYFIPMSIMFLGGNQSVADKIVGVSVERKRQHIDSNPSLKTRPSTWALLIGSTLAWAFLLTAVAYTGVWKFMATGLPKEPPAKNVQQYQTIADPTATAQLWPYLTMNLKEPTSVVRKIELFEASPNPFTFRMQDSHTVLPLNPDEYLKQLSPVRFVRVSVAPFMFTVTRMIIVHNFLGLGRSTTTRRPSFALLQLASDQKYGLFTLNSQENILICWMGSDANPVDFPMEAHPRYGIQPLFSFSEIYNLLLGNVAIVDELLRG